MNGEPIHFKVNEELKVRFRRLPWGMRSAALRSLTERMCDIYERHGEIGLGAIISGEYTFESPKIV